MVDVKQLVTTIVSDLAQTLLTHVFTAGEKTTLDRLHGEAKDTALMDRVCAEAVDRILRVLDTPRRSPGCDVMESDEGNGSEHAYFLVYGSAAVDSGYVLVCLQGGANAEGEDQSPKVTGEVTAPPAHFPDHEYAQPPSSPPAAANSNATPANATAGAAGEEPVEGAGCGRQRRRKKKKDPDSEVPLECSLCRKLFPNTERLSDHRRKSHPQCSVCAAPFGGVLKLREHERREHGLLPHACDFCPKRFNHKAHRDLHVRARHTGDKSCRCDICGKGYASAGVLRTHRVTHFDKTFVCDVCGRSFYHACHLTRHKLAHQDEPPFRCPTCGRGFTQAANLRSHQRAVHAGERHLCSVCGKSYRRLRNHVISKHAQELSASDAAVLAVCDVCGKKFADRSRLRVHRRCHTGEKPFRCDLCDRSFGLKAQLRAHRLTHGAERPYYCSLCPESFNMASSFLQHHGVHGAEAPHSCHVCGKHFRLLAFLKAHLRTKGHLSRAQKQVHPPLTSDLSSHQPVT